MDVSQLTGATTGQNSAQVQGTGGASATVTTSATAATAATTSASAASNAQINDLFTDSADGTSSISQSQFSAYLNTLAQSGGYNNQGSRTQSATGSAQSTFSILA